MFGSAAQTERRREARQPDLGEEAAIDEEDRDRVSVTASELRVPVHVHFLPAAGPAGEDRVHLPAHLDAEMAARPGQQRETRQRWAWVFDTMYT